MIKVEKINGNLHVEMAGDAMELGEELFEATKAFYDTVAKKDKMMADVIVDAKVFLNILGYEKREYKYLDYNAPEDAPQDLFKEE